MKIMVLSEGDPDAVLTGSGSVQSLTRHLRLAGQRVVKGDTQLRGAGWAAGAVASFSPRRRRWGVKFHTGPLAFALRSLRAATAISKHSADLGAIIQYGSTFAPHGKHSIPYYLYMDSCLRIVAGASQSWAGALTKRQLAAAIAREQRVFDRAAGIFTLSEGVRRAFIDTVGIPAERVVTTYAGPNLDFSLIPDRSRITPPGPTILFVGVEFERKGGDRLLRAFARVRGRFPEARLVIVGPRQLQVSQPGVKVLGFLSKDNPDDWQRLVEAYRSADVFCLPTQHEPFGIVLLEAMLFGLPCVATNTGAIPEIVSEGETGFLVPGDDEAALSRRLETLLLDPLLAKQLGENGRRRAEQHFTWPAVVAKMLGVISEQRAQSRSAA